MSEFQKLWDHLDTNEEMTHTLPENINLEKLFDELQLLDAKAHQYDEIAHTLYKEGLTDLRYNLHGNILIVLKMADSLRERGDQLLQEIDGKDSEIEALEEELHSYQYDDYLCEDCGGKR